MIEGAVAGGAGSVGLSPAYPRIPRDGLTLMPFSSNFCSMNWRDRITIDPNICHGKPVIRGLRYPVESMIEYLAGGDTIEGLLAQFPDLEREDILACLEFAA